MIHYDSNSGDDKLGNVADDQQTTMLELSTPPEPQQLNQIIATDDSPDSLRVRIPAVKDHAERCYLQLARDLWMVNTRQHYKSWGFESFDDYVTDLGIPPDRARRLRQLWSRLISTGVRPSSLSGVSFSNARLLVNVINKDNAETWIEKSKTLSYRELQHEVEAALPPPPPIPPPADGSQPVLLQPGQIQSQKTVKRVYYLMPDQATVVDEAITEAATISSNPSESANLANVATAFLAQRVVGENKSDAENRLTFLLRHLERVFGGKLLWVKRAEAFDALQTAIDAHPELFKTGNSQPHHTSQPTTATTIETNQGQTNERSSDCNSNEADPSSSQAPPAAESGAGGSDSGQQR